MTQSTTAQARRVWHAIAELVLAGPQYRRSGTIRLRVVPDGFATTMEPELTVVADQVIGAPGAVPIDGRTCAELATAFGVDAGRPEGLYHDGSGVDVDDVLRVDPAAARLLADALATGQAALRGLVPGRTPVLWPEHFDLGITVDEVNYGVSLGDGYEAEPYAYVGPWQLRQGPFWNAPFGAARQLGELAAAENVTAFFAEGRALAAAGEAR